MTGVFLDLASLDRGDLDLDGLWRCLPEWRRYAATRPEQTGEHIAGAEVVISNKVVLNADHLAKAPGLKLICVSATGYDHIDIDAARRAGIAVCNVTGYATASVVQHVYALILALSTRLGQYREAVIRGDWSRGGHFCLLDYPIEELSGKTLGIIGYGELGRAVAAAGRAFGLEIIVARGRGSDGPRLPLDEVLQRADILSLHCPLTESTRHLIGVRELALMKPSALLINTARGGIVDEQALLRALQAGEIAGAGIDVLGDEPPPPNHPLLDDRPNLIVTPHIAWASRQARQRLVNELAANIQAFRQGRRRNRVD